MQYVIKNKILYVNKGIKKVDYQTFKDIDSNIKEIVLPEGLITIGRDSFFDLLFIEKINIPKSVTKICQNAFWGNDSLTEIYLSSNVKMVESRAFCNCKNLTIFVDKNEYLSNWNSEWCDNIKEVIYKN